MPATFWSVERCLEYYFRCYQVDATRVAVVAACAEAGIDPMAPGALCFAQIKVGAISRRAAACCVR
jgi:hypothetical protein